jgi:hypothetical protein
MTAAWAAQGVQRADQRVQLCAEGPQLDVLLLQLHLPLLQLQVLLPQRHGVLVLQPQQVHTAAVVVVVVVVVVVAALVAAAAAVVVVVAAAAAVAVVAWSERCPCRRCGHDRDWASENEHSSPP